MILDGVRLVGYSTRGYSRDGVVCFELFLARVWMEDTLLVINVDTRHERESTHVYISQFEILRGMDVIPKSHRETRYNI